MMQANNLPTGRKYNRIYKIDRCYRRPVLHLYTNTTIIQKIIVAIIPIKRPFPANQSAMY